MDNFLWGGVAGVFGIAALVFFAVTLFKRGALLGIVRFSSQWKDYRESAVKAGVYALRYAAQPADGDHKIGRAHV